MLAGLLLEVCLYRRRVLSSRWQEPRLSSFTPRRSSLRAGGVEISLDMPITTVEYICHEAAVGVHTKPFILRGFGEAVDGLVFRPRFKIVSIMPGMERAEPERTLTKQRAFWITEFLPGGFSEFLYVVNDLFFQLTRILLAVLVEVIAGFGGDGETAGTGNRCGSSPRVPRLCAQEIAHSPSPSDLPCTKEIDPLFHFMLT